METPNDSVNKKPKRLTSVVWNHFERVKKADLCYAVCVHCNKKLSGSSNSGTTHLRNHLMRCLKRSNFDVSQLLAAKRKKKDSNTLALTNISYDEEQKKDENISIGTIQFEEDQKKEVPITYQCISKFDQERSRLDLARMIILHGYPLAMVDHIGFKVFVKNLQPLFELTTNDSIELECMEIYGKEKQKVYEMVKKLHCRVSFTVDKWTAPENTGYWCLTAHYIEENWKLQKKILNFIAIDSSQAEDALSDVIIKCLMEWDLDRKLFSMTIDDLSTSDDTVFRIKDWLSQTRPLLSNGQLFDMRCATTLLNLIVQDALETLREVIRKIRESIKHVKNSQATQGKFNEVAQQAGINTQKCLFLDSQVQWNSTYRMLETALEYRSAFAVFHEHDPSYTMALSDAELELASSITACLKLLSEIINVIAGNKHPTANIYFPEICDVHIQLIEWCKSPDPLISSMALKMREKFDRYWNKCSLSLAIAAILDPRFKMKLVEYYYTKIYGSNASDYIKEVSDGVKELFNQYSMGSTSASIDQGPARPGNCLLLPSTSNDRLKGFDKFLHETSQSQSVVSDLDKYLEEPVFPRNFDFNILNWWKVHTPRYPVLAMMVRDVLGVPMSTVAVGSLFHTEGRVLDHYRSSLNPDTLQALICTQDWLRAEKEEPSPSLVHTAVPLFIDAK